jgi:putative spermidine/putrescine transport system permease protein
MIASLPPKTPARRRAGYGSRLAFAAGLALTLAIASFLILPAILSMLAGVTANYFRGLASGLTLRWVAEVLALYSDTIVLTLALALATLATTLVLGVPAAWFLVRNPSRTSRAVEELLTLPIAVPGLAIALALILVWGGAGDLRTSWAFILIGHVLFTLPFMVRAVAANLQAIDARTLEEGAASLGAGPWRRFLEVIVPNARPGILAGALMVVTLSIGEFNLTWMLHTPLTKTLPVGLADSYASMRLEVASAYTLVFFVMIVPLLVAMQWLGGLGLPGGRAPR